MSSATSTDLTLPSIASGPTYFLLRRLHSLTGLMFGGYLVVHLVVNATIAQLGRIYQLQVDQIHRLPLLWAWEWGLIYLPILYHIVYGLWITLTGQPNNSSYPYSKNWFYLLQRVSAIFIVVFMFFHVFAFKAGWFGYPHFNELDATGSVHQHLLHHPAWTWTIYPIGILASCYHLANGFWTAAITWGLTISAGAQRRWGYVCTGIFVATLALGLTALIAATTITPAGPEAPAKTVNAPTIG